MNGSSQSAVFRAGAVRDRRSRREEGLTPKSEVRSPKSEVDRSLAPAAVIGQRPVLLLGLGNDILSDDVIGLVIAGEVRRRLPRSTNIDVVETTEMGLSLLDFVVGYRDLVLVDAVQTHQAPPGYLHEMDGEALRVLPTISPHLLGVGEMLTLGRLLGLPVPSRVKILAVEVADPFTIGTHLTPSLQQALPALVDWVIRLLGDHVQVS